MHAGYQPSILPAILAAMPVVSQASLAIDYSNATIALTSMLAFALNTTKPAQWVVANCFVQANISALGEFELRADGIAVARGSTQCFGGSFREAMVLQAVTALAAGAHTFELFGRLTIAGTLFCRAATIPADEAARIVVYQGYAP